MDSFTISKNDSERLDLLLARKYQDRSRSYFQYLIENQSVLINGSPAKKRIKPKLGDHIEIIFLHSPELSLTPENIPLDIIYEDDDLIAVNKPQNMVVHPAPGHPNGTFANALLYHCKQLSSWSDSLRPGIVHRLDKDTSGVLLAAKTIKAHQNLITLFSSRQIKKTYLGISLGNPGKVEINASIGRHPVHRKKMTVSEGGRDAITLCEPLISEGLYTLSALYPITGRTHQIRVHLKHKNAPLLGDSLYGNQKANEKEKLSGQLLHAYAISFPHPISNQPLKLVVNPPPIFMKAIQKYFCINSIQDIYPQ